MALKRDLATALVQLRSLRGLSLSETAAVAGLSLDEVEQAEAGLARAEVFEALTALYGLRDDGLDDEFAASNDTSQFTVFLLHSDAQSFDLADLRSFERAMRVARLYTAFSPTAQLTFARRRRFSATPPARPNPRDAAKQGHALARRVRTELANSEAPLGDMRALLEEHFGIPVLVEGLRTSDLRAAAALDAERNCASVVIAAYDDARARNPWLARVYLAHELCHLLFDPCRTGRVQIALDDRMQGRSLGRNALLESRAKGFAAEFLLPERGLQRLFGGVRLASDLEAARVMVRRAAEHFQAPWEITLRHLGNLDFLSADVTRELLDRRELITGPDSTTLPASQEVPHCVRNVASAVALWQQQDLRAKEVPAFVRRAHDAAHDATLTLVRETLEAAQADAVAGRAQEATDRLIAHLDELIEGDELVRARLLFDHVDVNLLPPPVTTSLAALSWHARATLGDARARYVERLLAALPSAWGFSAERVRKLEARLR